METNQATFSSLYFIKNANKYTDNPKEDIRNYLPTDAVLMWFAAGGNHSGLGKAERERAHPSLQGPSAATGSSRQRPWPGPGGVPVRKAGEGPKTCYFHLLGKLTWDWCL